jgi:hypothetical protein
MSNDNDNKALFADGFDEAFLGMGRQFNKDIAVYDYNKCLDILIERDGMDVLDAIEHLEHNVIGAWVGEFTPIFLETDVE